MKAGRMLDVHDVQDELQRRWDKPAAHLSLCRTSPASVTAHFGGREATAGTVDGALRALLKIRPGRAR